MDDLDAARKAAPGEDDGAPLVSYEKHEGCERGKGWGAYEGREEDDCDEHGDFDDFVTERLVLHPMTLAEARRVVSGKPGPDDRWAPGYPAPMDVEGAADFVNACLIKGDPQPFGAYEIRRRSDGLAIGGLGFNRPPDEEGTTTIGYALVPSARGRGYATEALRALLAFARARGLSCVKGDADLANLASQRVMRAAGMRWSGEDERVRYYETDWEE
ncbi:hypothetical protein SLNWT_4509 [Streptomyces albus]|uniref:N-acetyltransferase domain-containing protein n=1 Tax=Streptomyces albus (strain ATCC 21838 / DSM 41398 / FERM P-419 / JCM 4703 / NBRC 107858) TaxID=1081613 RepID=A0A0B5EZW7_STRA4|nr:hypothetical protein SLNWT_4509 [Streptomyces albus]AOU79192.1 hypothetical protein SLNHY_4501 [Streptomyces albus]AYN34925.1 N-acetyltransferase [Streptomyces albus]